MKCVLVVGLLVCTHLGYSQKTIEKEIEFTLVNTESGQIEYDQMKFHKSTFEFNSNITCFRKGKIENWNCSSKMIQSKQVEKKMDHPYLNLLLKRNSVNLYVEPVLMYDFQLGMGVSLNKKASILLPYQFLMKIRIGYAFHQNHYETSMLEDVSHEIFTKYRFSMIQNRIRPNRIK